MEIYIQSARQQGKKAAFKSLFTSHVYLPYPEGHRIKNTCIKCGRAVTDEIHIVVKDVNA